MQKITLDSHCNAGERHTEGVKRPKYRKDRELHLDCHCEEGASTTKQSSGLPRYACGNDAECVAFTLAEVLITLTIIGVIAALTIPNLMQKWSDHADVMKVKEAYSILSNAMKMAVAENGRMDEWAFPENKSFSANNSEYLGNILAKYLKVQKYCGKNDGCFSKNILRVDGNKGGALYNGEQGGRMILSNGMNVMIWSGNINSFNNNVIMIDINGLKKPNRVGYDVFYLGFNQNGLDWRGHGWLTTKAYCNPTVNTNTGESCTYWVIKHGNMDYKYRDVSAEW